eukprot:SAG22_NODE_2412_length_2602_cov_1.623252_2_plen_85_part_00
MAEPALEWTDYEDIATLRLSGLPHFSGGGEHLVARLPGEGSAIRLEIRGVTYIDGELFAAVDPDRSAGAVLARGRTNTWPLDTP